MRRATTAALEQVLAEPGADPLTERQRRVRLGERPPTRLAIEPPLTPQQPSDAPRDRQIAHPHDRPILHMNRPAPAPPTTPGADRELNLELELLAQLDHPGHDQPIDPDKTTNVTLHPLFLLFRVFDNAKPREGSGCLYPSLNPARSTRPED